MPLLFVARRCLQGAPDFLKFLQRALRIKLTRLLLLLLLDHFLNDLPALLLGELALHLLLLLEERDYAVGRRRQSLQQLLPALAGSAGLDLIRLLVVGSISDGPHIIHGHVLDGFEVYLDVCQRGLLS